MSTTLATSASTTTHSFNPYAYVTSDNFMGWYIGGSANPTEPITCGLSSTWTTSSAYGQCHGENDLWATGCSGNILLAGTVTMDCIANSYSSCGAAKIYQTEGDTSAPWTWYACFDDLTANSVYRELTAEPISTASATAPATNLAVTTSSATQSTSTSTATSLAVSGKSTGHSGLSGGAIAGIVIGCVAVVVIGLLILLRKRLLACMGYSRTSPQQPQQPTVEVDYSGPPPITPTAMGWNASELAGSGTGYKQPGTVTTLSDSTPSQLAGSESGISSPIAQLEGSESMFQTRYSGVGHNPPMHEMP